MIFLETDRLILRDYTEHDFEGYCKLKMDAKTMYYLQDIQLHSLEEARSDFYHVLNDIKSPERKFYFLHMELKDTHEQVGSIGYTVVANTPLGKLVHLGYFTYSKFWGNGYTSEAMKKVLEYAFAENDVYRIMGAKIPTDEELKDLEEFDEFVWIDLGYVLPGLIDMWEEK